jgi:hypothetical protein
MDDFLSEAHDSTIKPHPLKENSLFTIDAKISYLALVLFSLLVDQGELDSEKEQFVHDLGVSLGISDSEIQTMRSTISSLNTSQERIGFIKENVSAVQERDIAMFLYCEMAKAINLGENASKEATSFLNGMMKLLQISSKDASFLQEYLNYFSNGTAEEIFPFIQSNQDSGITLPQEFVRYFTPQAMPVPLSEGPLPDGETRIENGMYMLTGEMKVHARAILIAKNATIILTNNAYINIEQGKVTFENCKFIAHDDGAPIKNDYMIVATGKDILEISHCEFHGHSRRSGINNDDGKLTVKNCIFEKLYGEGHGILASSDKLECYDSSFSSCTVVSGNGLICVYTEDQSVTLYKCTFTDCSAPSLSYAYGRDDYHYYLLKIVKCNFTEIHKCFGLWQFLLKQLMHEHAKYISVVDSIWDGPRHDPEEVQKEWDKED